MKTISELNSRPWYRLIKVVFVVAFLLATGFLAYRIYNLYRWQYSTDLKVTCKYGNHSEFLAHQDKGISINGYDPDADHLPAGLNDAIMTACGITQADVAAAQLESQRETAEIDKAHNFFGVSIGVNTYNLKPTYLPEDNMFNMILIEIGSILVLLGVFELLRRIFHYVVLGSFLPMRK